ELTRLEERVPAVRRVVRGDRLERAPVQVAREDDVDDVLRVRAPPGRDRVDDRDRTLDRQLLVDADLLAELPVESGDEALPRVHAPARQQPVLPARLLVADEEDAAVPAQDRRDPDPRLRAHPPQGPQPPAPRSPS